MLLQARYVGCATVEFCYLRASRADQSSVSLASLRVTVMRPQRRLGLVAAIPHCSLSTHCLPTVSPQPLQARTKARSISGAALFDSESCEAFDTPTQLVQSSYRL